MLFLCCFIFHFSSFFNINKDRECRLKMRIYRGMWDIRCRGEDEVLKLLVGLQFMNPYRKYQAQAHFLVPFKIQPRQVPPCCLLE